MPLPPNIHFHWKDRQIHGHYRSGVSLHSHTLHSKELLDFIPRYAARIPALNNEVNRLRARFESFHRRPLDFRSGWWTPPLDTAGALDLESAQIGNLGLRPFVSLTDHDCLEASRLEGVVCSIELTVDLGPAFIHLGIHNLPRHRAPEVFAFANTPAALMSWLRQFPNVLLVFNHPCWDESVIGPLAHRAMAESFISEFSSSIHALELNGLRPWSENLQVIELARKFNLPVISGGDRHGLEPNANINLTNASSFDEFVEEIRGRRQSAVLFLPQYRTPYAFRIATNLMEILQEQPSHSLGWRRWTDRVFYEVQPGQPRSLTEYWNNGEPTLVRLFVLLVQFLHNSGRVVPIRFAPGILEECRP